MVLDSQIISLGKGVEIMTEKRFTSKVVDWWHNVDEVRVVFDNGEWIDADNCAKLLNALHEENQQLKNKLSKIEKKIKVLQSL